MFYNINLGVPMDDQEVIKEIEVFLDKDQYSYDSEGSDTSTYNINVGTDSEELRDKLVAFVKDKGVYVDTETFDESTKRSIKQILEGADPRELLIEEQTLACSSCQNYDVTEKKCKTAGAVSKAHSKEKMLRWVANPNVGNDCSKYKGIETKDVFKGDLKKSGADVKVEGDPQGILNKGAMK